MDNRDIVEQSVPLMKTCVSYALPRYHIENEYYDDIFQELALILLEYPNDRLNTIFSENHMNAFITGILKNQLCCKSSMFYRKHLRLMRESRPIDDVPVKKLEDYYGRYCEIL